MDCPSSSSSSQSSASADTPPWSPLSPAQENVDLESDSQSSGKAQAQAQCELLNPVTVTGTTTITASSQSADGQGELPNSVTTATPIDVSSPLPSLTIVNAPISVIKFAGQSAKPMVDVDVEQPKQQQQQQLTRAAKTSTINAIRLMLEEKERAGPVLAPSPGIPSPVFQQLYLNSNKQQQQQLLWSGGSCYSPSTPTALVPVPVPQNQIQGPNPQRYDPPPAYGESPEPEVLIINETKRFYDEHNQPPVTGMVENGVTFIGPRGGNGGIRRRFNNRQPTQLCPSGGCQALVRLLVKPCWLACPMCRLCFCSTPLAQSQGQVRMRARNSNRQKDKGNGVLHYGPSRVSKKTEHGRQPSST